MSWDVLVLCVPPDVHTIDDLEDDLNRKPLGTYEYVRDSIQKIWPSVKSIGDKLDDGYHQIDQIHTDGYSIEFFLKKAEPEADMLTFFIRGRGDVVLHLKELCEQTGWSIYDISGHGFMDFGPRSEASWQKWQAYRDHVVGKNKGDASQENGNGAES